MKKRYILICLTLAALILSLSTIRVSADFGPKPSSYISIKGIEGEYTAAFAAKDSWGLTYEDWLENDASTLEYHPIMEYQDEDGFHWITWYTVCSGDSQIRYTYYCPNEFKIIIYQDDELAYASEPLKRYAYASYYEINFSTGDIHSGTEEPKITKTYSYGKEILGFIARFILTLVIELLVFFLMRLYTKRNLKIVLIMNGITQLLLNVCINIEIFNSGWLSAIFLLFILEFIVLLIEVIFYSVLMKDKKRWVITLYPFIANLLSFFISFFLIVLI